MRDRGLASLLLLIIVLIVVAIGTVIYTKINERDFKSICVSANGKWLPEFKECENMEREACYKNLGEWNGCASPCRHDPNANVCVELCQEVCKF